MKDTGASPKVLEIDMASTVPPFTFEAAFRAAYSGIGRHSFTSRAIVALNGPGTVVLKDGEGHSVTLSMVDREVCEFEAVSVVSNSGVTKIRVML